VIVPTIGRVVWFHEAFEPDTVEQPKAAIVCYVHNDRLVNLAVFEPHGGTGARTSVPLRQEGDVAPSGPFCEWMPYQIGQAKTTQAQAQQSGPQLQQSNPT
jgi:hypothetical protein